MNGTDARVVAIDLAFLGKDPYKVTLVRDKVPTETLVSFNRKRVSFGSKSGVLVDTLTSGDLNGEKLIVELLPAGGFVAMFDRVEN